MTHIRLTVNDKEFISKGFEAPTDTIETFIKAMLEDKPSHFTMELNDGSHFIIGEKLLETVTFEVYENIP